MATRRSMKILHILDRSFPYTGGYTSRAHYIIQHQKKLGLEPIVLTSYRHISEKDVEMMDGNMYYRMHSTVNPLFKIPILKELLEIYHLSKRIDELINTEEIQILHAHSPVLLGIAAIKAGVKNRIKTIYEIRAFWEDAATASNKYTERSLKYKMVRSLETQLCKRVDHIVTIAEGLCNDLIKRGISTYKINIVPNGVDHDKFTPLSKNKILVDKLKLDGKIVIGYIGQFFNFEGVSDLIDTMFTLTKERTDIFFLLVGGGEEEAEISQKFNEQTMSNIHFEGRVPHDAVIDYYSVIDIFVYPRKSSRVTELTTPLKPLEALAMGKATVSSSVGGLIELVGKENGLFFPSGDKRALMECISRLLEDESLRIKLGKKGREMVLNQRTWAEISKKYIGIYKKMK